MRFLAAVFLFATACTGTDGPGFRGEEMADYFPFDGDRVWTFTSTDVSLPHQLVGTELAEETVDETLIYGIEYTKDCFGNDPSCVDGEFVWAIGMSTYGSNGVQVHWVEDQGGRTTYDPPVQLAEQYMLRGDVVESTSNGTTWTSTLNGFVECPVDWSVSDWDNCAHFTVSGGDGRLVGDFWAIAGFNIVAFENGNDGQWQLSNHDDGK